MISKSQIELLIKVNTEQEFMRKDIDNIKKDVNDIKDDLDEIKTYVKIQKHEKNDNNNKKSNWFTKIGLTIALIAVMSEFAIFLIDHKINTDNKSHSHFSTRL